MGNMFTRPRPALPTFNSIADVHAFNRIAVGVPVATEDYRPSSESANAERLAPSANPSAERLSLNVSSDKTAVDHGCEQTILAMLSLKAPAAPEDVKRPAMDLVCCIDRSGSMRGEKMRLMVQTLNLLITRAGLTGNDRVSLVTFDSNVKCDLPLEYMTKEGRAKAEAIVKGLQPGATTNLSGGALKAIDVLDASSPVTSGKADDQESRTRACMIFTDGLANEGIRDPDRLVTAVTSALTAAASKGGPISLFTFGFGADHNETCLRALATGSGASGLYYFMDKAEDIPNAFADALGGLTSVVAQNTILTLEAVGEGVTIKQVLGSTYTRDPSTGAIELGDLFAEDEKDVLLYLTLPKLSAPAGPTAVLRSTVRAFNVARSAAEVVEVTLEVARPVETPAGQAVNLQLDAQRNRIEAAEAMEKATRMADAGDVEGGRATLAACRDAIAHTPSAEADYALSHDLVGEIAGLEEQYQSASRYRSVGSKMSKMSSASHQRQRAVHSNAGIYAGGAKHKKAMKMQWMSSISSSGFGTGSDSD